MVLTNNRKQSGPLPHHRDRLITQKIFGQNRLKRGEIVERVF